MAKINIIYGSTTGSTERVAGLIANKLSNHQVKLTNISTAIENDFTSYDLLIVGTSTWGFGEQQDDWADFEAKISSLQLAGKKMAFFGLGDQDGYPDTFIDAMGILLKQFKECGIDHIGTYSNIGFAYDFSKAELENNKFVGLAIDEDNQPNLTESRITEWTTALIEEL